MTRVGWQNGVPQDGPVVIKGKDSAFMSGKSLLIK
jgi:hypothetical protein